MADALPDLREYEVISEDDPRYLDALWESYEWSMQWRRSSWYHAERVRNIAGLLVDRAIAAMGAKEIVDS